VTISIALVLAGAHVLWLSGVQTCFGGVLAGPLHFVTEGPATDAKQGAFLYALLLPCVFAFSVQPHWLTGLLSLAGLTAWLFCGLIGLAASV